MTTEAGSEPDPTMQAVVDEALALGADDLGMAGNPGAPFAVRNGTIRLRAVSAPPHLIADIETRWPEPQPPVHDIVNEETGEVRGHEPNTGDPDYRREHKRWNDKVETSRQRALIATALQVVDVDEGLDLPDDDGWAEALQYVGAPIDIPAKKTRARVAAWLMYYALTDILDLSRATMHALRMVGTPEEDVSRMARLFRDLPGRGTTQS